jgi:hypothetical protein
LRERAILRDRATPLSCAEARTLHAHVPMDLAFERKLRAAVSAGVRVLVVEVGLLTIVWVIHLAAMAAHPSAVLALWGPDVSWSMVAAISLHAIATFKVALWLQAALLAWGWVWASMLRRMREGSVEQRSEPARRDEAAARG